MKVGLVGNCQVRGLRECLQALAPSHSFEAIQVEQLKTEDHAILTRVIELASEVDVLFFHGVFSVSAEGPQQALSQALIAAKPRKLIAIPSIMFSGFHPDCCVIVCNERYLTTATYNYHSAIVAGAFLNGLPASRVPALFNRFIYAGLGYMSDFEHHRQDLLIRFAQLNFDAEPIMASAKVFMHCPNHPVVEALFELAKQMIARLGIPAEKNTPPEDWMKKFTLLWPVYPGLFTMPELNTRTSTSPIVFTHAQLVISLNEMIDSSFASYAEHSLTSSNMYAPAALRAANFLESHLRA